VLLTLLGDFSAFIPKLGSMGSMGSEKWKLGTMFIAVTLAALGACFLMDTQVMNLDDGKRWSAQGFKRNGRVAISSS
jgi:hypothetical protein